MSSLRELYQEVILDHNRHPRNFGKLDPADASADGHNPLCGDKLTVYVKLDGDRITDVSFSGVSTQYEVTVPHHGAITVFVCVLLLWVIVRFNAKANPKPAPVHAQRALVLGWVALWWVGMCGINSSQCHGWASSAPSCRPRAPWCRLRWRCASSRLARAALVLAHGFGSANGPRWGQARL